MTPKQLCILLLALVAVWGVAAQSEDITVENDNQFPPENPADPDLVETGSGDGAVVEQPQSADVSTTPVPLLEDVQPTASRAAVTTQQEGCPTPCVCHYSGEDFVVDCSGYELTQFPSPIDPKTTTLNVQNNKLTEIPKEVSALKKLKVLNAENNLIMDLALGSVSDLPELTVLKLAKNKLVGYPKDLKNSLQLTKLEELDLGANDMRTELTPETLANFQSLRKLTLAVSTPELIQALCSSFKSSLEYVCTETCETRVDCLDAPMEKIEDGFIDASLPGTILFEGDQDSDPAITNPAAVSNANTDSGTEQAPVDNNEVTTETETTIDPKVNHANAAIVNSGRASIVAENPTKDANTKTETDVNVGAATKDTKSGGIDKSVIGMIVAGMVVVVAGITIKKNWSSIKKRFSSTPRPAERAGANGNGTSPEEVPLQDKNKSPV